MFVIKHPENKQIEFKISVDSKGDLFVNFQREKACFLCDFRVEIIDDGNVKFIEIK